jgi:hypothetical protein
MNLSPEFRPRISRILKLERDFFTFAFKRSYSIFANDEIFRVFLGHIPCGRAAEPSAILEEALGDDFPVGPGDFIARLRGPVTKVLFLRKSNLGFIASDVA